MRPLRLSRPLSAFALLTIANLSASIGSAAYAQTKNTPKSWDLSAYAKYEMELTEEIGGNVLCGSSAAARTMFDKFMMQGKAYYDAFFKGLKATGCQQIPANVKITKIVNRKSVYIPNQYSSIILYEGKSSSGQTVYGLVDGKFAIRTNYLNYLTKSYDEQSRNALDAYFSDLHSLPIFTFYSLPANEYAWDKRYICGAGSTLKDITQISFKKPANSKVEIGKLIQGHQCKPQTGELAVEVMSLSKPIFVKTRQDDYFTIFMMEAKNIDGQTLKMVVSKEEEPVD